MLFYTVNAMSDAQWDSLWNTFHELLELPGPDRQAALDQLRSDDPDLHQELVRLLAAHDAESPSPLDRSLEPLSGLAAGLAGQSVGPWRLEHEVGRGGMGAVYLAHRADGTFARQVAIKFVARHRDEDSRRRFQTERELLGRLKHPLIAGVIDAGETDEGIPYLVMEWVDGLPLDEYCERHRVSIPERLRLFVGICQAAHLAHQNLVVHRDLKPSNVLVTNEGEPRLLDFGIAQPLDAQLGDRTRQQMTPDYASPEQMRGEPVSTAADVYALGVMLYESLSGRKPFELASASLADMVNAICESDPPAPSSVARNPEPLRGDLDAIVRTAMARDPARRYPSAQALADDLERHLKRQPVIARPPGRWYRLSRFVARHRVGVTLSSLALVTLLGFSLVLLRQSRELSVALASAEAQTAQSRAAFRFLTDLLLEADPERNLGAPLTVVDVLDQGAVRLMQEFRNQPLLRAELAETVGQVYLHLGQHDQSREFFELALADAPGSPASLSGIAAALALDGDPGAAEQLQRQAISTLDAAGEVAQAAEARLALAATLQAQSRLEEAEQVLSEALAVPRIDPLAAARARIRLGALRWGQGRLDLAAAEYQRALVSFRDNLGDEHPETARAHFALGAAHHRLGEYQIARNHYARALALRRAVYGQQHPLVARSLESLGALEYDAGDAAAARPLLEEALTMRGALSPDAPAASSGALNNLALVLHDLGRFDEAESRYREALAMNQATFADPHEVVAGNFNNLGLLALDRGQPENALPLFEQAVEIYREVFDQGHPTGGYSAHFLGRTYLALRDYDKARSWLNQAVELRRNLRGGRHPQLADTLVWRSHLNALDDALDEGLDDAREALDIRTELLEANDWRLAEARFQLGLLQGMSGYADGEALRRQGLEDMQRIRGTKDWRTRALVARQYQMLCEQGWDVRGADCAVR
ncbi:MAG: tetratricopeptide repeat protein [Pseudomonadota bacterium]